MRYTHLGQEIIEYKDIHIYVSKEDPKWAVNDWNDSRFNYSCGPCIAHYCHQPIYQMDAWNYVISPMPGNRFWVTQMVEDGLDDPRQYFKCSECMELCPDDVRTVFLMYRDRK
jgi:hypothetical protein